MQYILLHLILVHIFAPTTKPTFLLGHCCQMMMAFDKLHQLNNKLIEYDEVPFAHIIFNSVCNRIVGLN